MHNSLISLALTILMLPSFLSDNDLKQNESSKVALLQRSVSLFDLKEGRNSDLKEKDKEVKRWKLEVENKKLKKDNQFLEEIRGFYSDIWVKSCWKAKKDIGSNQAMTVINCCEELHNRSFLLLEKVTTLEREREILLEKVSKLQKDIFLLSVERKVFVDFTKRICFDCQKKVLIQRKNEKVSDIIKEVTQQTSGFSEEDSLDDKVYEHEKERRRKKRFSSI